jgi:hypothetical protein
LTPVIFVSDADQAPGVGELLHGGDRLPLLYDVTLPAMSPQAFTLIGFERIEGADYAQSWLITQV